MLCYYSVICFGGTVHPVTWYPTPCVWMTSCTCTCTCTCTRTLVDAFVLILSEDDPAIGPVGPVGVHIADLIDCTRAGEV
jgi:hypothetical protein